MQVGVNYAQAATSRFLKPAIVDCTFTIQGSQALLEGQYPLQKVKNVTSFYVDGFQFSPAFKRRKWDGRKHLFSVIYKSMPAGLVPLVVEELKKYSETAKIQIIDKREDFVPTIGNKGFDLHGIDFGQGIFDYQLEAVKAAISRRRGILKIATNGGKCLAPETPVLLHDGRTVRADEVKVGDDLLGPDSLPRRVLSTCSGVDVMYRVSPKRGGEAFTCNSVHVLTLWDEKTKDTVDVPLNEFLEWTDDRKRLSRLVKTGVDFPRNPYVDLLIDPWLLGFWYAEGRKSLSFLEFSNPEPEIEEELQRHAIQSNCMLKKYQSGKKCPQFRMVTPHGQENPLLSQFRFTVGTGARLPYPYLTASRTERAAFLAGFIDGDGYSDGKRIEVVQKIRRWAEDLAYLARSLGFMASVHPKSVKLDGWNEPKTYWRVGIVGDTSFLPLRLRRRHAKPAKQWSKVGFTVERLSEGSYAGFTLGSDGRFLLGDFTITHNTECACALTKHLAIPTVFLVERLELLHQTRKRFALRLGLPLEDIGIIGDSHCQIGSWITVATPKSLGTQIKKGNVVPGLWQMVISDESHHVGSDTHYEVLNSIPAYYRFGMSGTPLNRSDGADLRLIAQTGPVLYDVPNKLLVARGISVQPYVEMVTIDEPYIPESTTWAKVHRLGVVENEALNQKIIEKTLQHLSDGKQVLILVDVIKHGDYLDNRLGRAVRSLRFPTHHQFINGKEDTAVRIKALEDFKTGTTKCLIATPILDEGVDVPCIDVLILAGGGKSKIRLLQRAGRGLRTGKGKKKLLIIDFANFTHRYLLKHSLQRLRTYKGEECFVISTG